MTTTTTTSTTNISMRCELLTCAGNQAFPFRLYDMLMEVHNKGLTEIVSFHGNKHFMVHNRELFERFILPKFFQTQTHYKSFQRQLAMYGFTRDIRGPRKSAYTHKCLMRGCRDLCSQMIRNKPTRRRALRSLPPQLLSSSSLSSSSLSSLGGTQLGVMTSSAPSMSCFANSLNLYVSRGMEKVEVLPQPIIAPLFQEVPGASLTCATQFNKSFKIGDNISWSDRIGSLPGELVYHPADHHPSMIDLIEDAFCDIDLISFDAEPIPIRSVVDRTTSQNSGTEPFDANGGHHHGFTAEIADEVVRIFRLT